MPNIIQLFICLFSLHISSHPWGWAYAAPPPLAGAVLSIGGGGEGEAEGRELEATLENHCEDPVHVFQSSGSGAEEAFVFEMEPLSYVGLSTFTGHRFAIRRTDTNGLIKEVVIGSEAVIAFGQDGCATSTPAQPLDKGQSGSVSDGRSTHPMVEYMNSPVYATVQPSKFKSLSSRPVELWKMVGTALEFSQDVEPGADHLLYTTEGEVFVAVVKDDRQIVLGSFKIKPDVFVYIIRDAHEFTVGPDKIQSAVKEVTHQQEYLKRTGLHYVHYYGPDGPRAPPSLHMWPATEVGQVHKVNSSHGYWMCDDFKQCRTNKPLTLELKVVSTHPKIFIIEDFLSEAEADSIISHSRSRMFRSKVGTTMKDTHESDYRTSQTMWLARSSTDLIDTLHSRAADVLGVDDEMLRHDTQAENIQVLHYSVGQKYDAHYDWTIRDTPDSRYITLLLYLSTMPDRDSGGETAFPKADNGHGIKVHPRKGTAVLFYSLLEDGNADLLSLHQAMSVKKGEKWLANFWVWDEGKPRSRFSPL